MTICRQWSWKPGDNMKSLEQCIHALVRTAGGDGNLLFNVGPMPDGRIEPRQVERLREEGAWLKPRGQSVYGTRGGPFKPGKWGASTHRGKQVYLHVLHWFGGETLELPPIAAKVASARLLPDGTEVELEQSASALCLTVPEAHRDAIDTIVELKLDIDASTIRPLTVVHRSASLAHGQVATASNTFHKMDQYTPAKAFDDDETTRWATDAGTGACWIAVDLGEPQVVRRIVIDEWAERIQQFELQCKVGGKWRTFAKGTKVGTRKSLSFEPVEAREFRLNVLKASEGPTINEFQLFGS